MEKNRYVTTIRIPNSLFKRLEDISKRTGCNYNNLIYLALFNYLQDIEKSVIRREDVVHE